MFAPQTLRLRVPQQLENKQNSQVFCNSRMKPLPFVLIPVCRLFCAVDSFLSNFGVRLYVSDVWVGQRPL
jgi:hypothetical protein